MKLNDIKLVGCGTEYGFAIEVINFYVRYEIGKLWKLKATYYYSYHYSLLALKCGLILLNTENVKNCRD